MQTELAQIISLTSYGNEFINTGELPINYFLNNNIFQFCNLVDFRDFKKSFLSTKMKEIVSASNPLEWFILLKNEGCTKLRLYYRPSTDRTYGPEYNLAGLAGGAGTWLIETIHSNYSYFWQKKWQVTKRDATDRKIWSVNYSRILEKQKTINGQLDINQIRVHFENTIKELIDFCSKQNLKIWLETFDKAYKILSSETPNKEYYNQEWIVTKNYSLTAQQLLFAADTAWVFGGMGWWNDMGFKDKLINDKYLQLSDDLYEMLLQSIVGATNSF